MAIERVSQPDPTQTPATAAAGKAQVVAKFVAIESIGFVALVLFLAGFFVLDWFPGQPTGLLIGALVVFWLYVSFAAWASGLLAMIMADRNNAR